MTESLRQDDRSFAEKAQEQFPVIYEALRGVKVDLNMELGEMMQGKDADGPFPPGLSEKLQELGVSEQDCRDYLKFCLEQKG